MDNEFKAEEPLPAGFTTIYGLRSLTADTVKNAYSINVIGIVKDQQAPMLTKGTDAKYTIEIVDTTIPSETYGMKVNIFRPMDKMPRNVHCADVVLIRKIKAQIYQGNLSLLAGYQTELHFISSSTVPKSPQELKNVNWASYPPMQRGLPGIAECRYAAWLHSQVGELDVPSETEFEQRTVQSMQHRDKFRLLKDAKCDLSSHIFVNLIGEIVKVHDSGFDRLTLYLTDYTSNPKFYKYSFGGSFNDPDEIQDEYGYLQMGRPKVKKTEWPGPFGTMTIQITAYDDQASYIRQNIKANQWVFLNNVQIKYGNAGGLLEGFLRDREKICVKALDTSQEAPVGDTDSTEGRLSDALKRKLTWTKKFQQQKRALAGEDGDHGKRKREIDGEESEPKRPNAKERRKQERAAAERKVKELELKKAKLKNLNQNIKCQFPDQEPVSLRQILEPVDLILDGKAYQAPFTNSKYRANVRVVDYFPPRIEDFAVGFRSNEFDMLSDYSGAEESDAEIRREIWHSGKGFSKDCWEWRFALQVEDADSDKTGSKERMWLIVDNQSAQMLLNLPDDATSLRNDARLLAQVKEQMFKLWGDLEERKSAALPKVLPPAPSKTQSTAPFLSSSVPPSSPPRPAMPATESDDENETSQESRGIQCGQRSQDSALEERDSNILTRMAEGDSGNDNHAIHNKGFTCCIKQYGVKVDEKDPRKANAEDGKRWQRMFGLFGTMID